MLVLSYLLIVLDLRALGKNDCDYEQEQEQSWLRSPERRKGTDSSVFLLVLSAAVLVIVLALRVLEKTITSRKRYFDWYAAIHLVYEVDCDGE